ncbi:MAG: HEAT repeat protein [Verrucomicrobiales bacterium]|jgi:HEAT repeat protein
MKRSPKPIPIFASLAFLWLNPLLIAEEPIMDIYVSTGDNHFLGSSLPIDSPASIDATFDLFRDVHHARRIYWRGLEASCWLETMHARPENPRYSSFWDWLVELYETVSPDTLAVKAAHERGMEIWGMGSLWDWGGPADTPGFGDYPFTFESKLKLDHPEWAPIDKHGVRQQGGPIELAYPEARKALVDLTVQETLKAGYDGIALLTYVENYSIRFEDEFGYSDPIVGDFKRQYRIDIRTEPFRRGASRADWLRLRGGYVTAFLRELKTELAKHEIKLGMVINSDTPRLPQSWNVPELMITAGSQHMDIDTWVREGIVDELLIYGNNSGQSQFKTLDELQFLTRGTETSVSVITSGPFRAGWKPYQDEGVPTILAVSDDVQHLSRGFVPEQTVDALNSPELAVRLRVLQQVIDGELEADSETLTPLAAAENLIERRMALQALGKSKDPAVVPVIEKGLTDPENGVRCVAALALAQNHGPNSARALLEAVEKHGNHMLRECAIIALRRLQPSPVEELSAAALTAPNPRVREAAMRSLMPNATSSMLPTFETGLTDAERFPRFAAAEALGNIRKNPAAAEILIETLNHEDVAVGNRAAVSLGRVAARNEAELKSLRPKILDSLLAAFRRHADPDLADADWGWRPVGNAILDFGDEGAQKLREIRDHSENPRLAELAWRVVDLTQKMNTFSEVTAEQNEAAMARRPGGVSSDLRVDPKAGDDANDGRNMPVKTIARAMRLAQPGDTIHLTLGVYYESADFTNKHGLPGKPITLDGHGAVLDGSEPVTSKEWEQFSPDLYRRQHVYKRTDDALVARWFLLWDGKMQRMGRCSKGPSEDLKTVADLKPGEWTFVKDEDAFYLKLEPGQDLDTANIRYPKRSSAVVQSIAGSWLTVKNITGTHVYNDGFNIHGAQRNLVFENIRAIECGDDGFSAHEDVDCQIDGFVSIGNATGLCDTGTSQTHYRNVFIKDCHGFDLYFIGLKHSMENAVIESSAARTFWVDGNQLKDGQRCQVTLKNVLIQRVADSPQELRIGPGGILHADRCTFEDVNVMLAPRGAVDFQRCVFTGGEAKPDVLIFPNTIWQGAGNLYDIRSLRVAQTSFTSKTFADFQKLTGSESESRWDSAAAENEDIGVDKSILPNR